MSLIDERRDDVEAPVGPARHLIVLLDGTGVTATNLVAGAQHSNIYKLNLALHNHNKNFEAQIAFYIPGIGSSWSRRRPLAQMLGLGLVGDVEQAYINICSNYFAGPTLSTSDRIYLFGFSRGAVVARLVASLISKFGLLHATQLGRFADLWEVFLGTKEPGSLGKLLSDGVHKNVAIEFLGVFDTVIGRYNGTYAAAVKRHFFANRLLPLRIKHAVHLLALNETRPDFTSVAWTGLEQLVVNATSTHGFTSTLEQIWMPGAHTDVGGGYEENFLSNVALLTMLERIGEYTELKIRPRYLEKLKEEIEATLEDPVAPKVTINRETQFHWRLTETWQEGHRIPQRGQLFEHVHPVCELMNKALIRKEGEEGFVPYEFPRCDLPIARSIFFAGRRQQPT